MDPTRRQRSPDWREREKSSIKGVELDGGWPTNNQTHALIHAPNQKPTLQPTTPSIHVDPRRENKEQRTKGEKREQRETIRSHRTHDYQTTIAEPEPSPDLIHREREERRERGKRKENWKRRGSCKSKFFYFFLQFRLQWACINTSSL